MFTKQIINMTKQMFTKVHLSENSSKKLKGMRNSTTSRDNMRKSIYRQISFYVHSEPTKRCQLILLLLVILECFVIIGIITIVQFFPKLICKYVMNCEAHNGICRAKGIKALS